MIRLLAIALLAANLLLVGYRALGDSPRETPAIQAQRPMPSGLPGIPLLQELPAEETGPKDMCYTVGPFETEDSMHQVRDALQEMAGDMAERRTEALMELGFWVALPASKDLAAAAESERELRRKGIEDVAVVTGESGALYVSLGYFLDETNALERRDQIRELGYEATTRLRRERQSRYWLDYRALATTQPLPGTIPAGMRRTMPCAKVSQAPVTITPAPSRADPADTGDETVPSGVE